MAAERIRTDFRLEGWIESRQGGRAENQDAADARDTPLGTAIAVCDGMGGHKGGSTASALAVKTILGDLAAAPQAGNPAEALKAAVSRANRLIFSTGREHAALEGMGTTVTAVLVSGRCVTACHAGDSRIYQLRDGRKIFRTFDHSWVFELVSSGILTEERARTSPQSNLITQALGIEPEIEIETAELPYRAGDRFVLCTDGFWGALPERELIGLLSARGPIGTVLPQAADEIDRLGAESGGHHDNLTAAMFDLLDDSEMQQDL